MFTLDLLPRVRLRLAPCCEGPQAPQYGGHRHARVKEVEESIMTVPNRHAFCIMKPTERPGWYALRDHRLLTDERNCTRR